MFSRSSVTAAKVSLVFRAVLCLVGQGNCVLLQRFLTITFLWTGQAGRDGQPGEKGKGFL